MWIGKGNCERKSILFKRIQCFVVGHWMIWFKGNQCFAVGQRSDFVKMKTVFVIDENDFGQSKSVFWWLSLNCVDSNEKKNWKLPNESTSKQSIEKTEQEKQVSKENAMEGNDGSTWKIARRTLKRKGGRSRWRQTKENVEKRTDKSTIQREEENCVRSRHIFAWRKQLRGRSFSKGGRYVRRGCFQNIRQNRNLQGLKTTQLAQNVHSTYDLRILRAKGTLQFGRKWYVKDTLQRGCRRIF